MTVYHTTARKYLDVASPIAPLPYQILHWQVPKLPHEMLQQRGSIIDEIRSSLLSYQNVRFYTFGQLLLPEEIVESFALVDATTLGRVVSPVNPTICLFDPIPTSLLKTFYGFIEEQISNTVNCSRQTNVFPTAFKTVVKPLLKMSNLDTAIFSNYQLVSNLTFLSKI